MRVRGNCARPSSFPAGRGSLLRAALRQSMLAIGEPPPRFLLALSASAEWRRNGRPPVLNRGPPPPPGAPPRGGGVPSFERAGYARSRPRSCSRRSRSSTSPARTSASACTSPPIRAATSCACGPTSPSRCRATTWPRPRPASRRASAISARCSAIAATRRRIPAGRHRIVRPPRHRGGRRRDARARPRRHRALRPRGSPTSAWATSRCSPR